MKLTLTSYHRTFEAPGGPVVWALRVEDYGKIGDKNLAPQVIQCAESDSALVELAKEQGKQTWDEETLVECTRRSLELPADQKIKIQVPPIVGA